LGGGIENNGGSLMVLDCTIVSNTAAAGQVHAQGNPTVGGEARGGGVHSNGSFVMNRTTVADNIAIGGFSGQDVTSGLAGGNALGGGLFVGGDTASITDSTVSNNHATGGS